ncbi:hypothetical protein CDL12_05624 [Handroanthus impetiginosus]|uniref:Uncharacterized protein n=1 Tax=Handroanthus impetiginosus TaxID=429701 RepID=A0A2G9HVW8_9LAMI|nr:hypothetical protein CDL12_05624 [Handroanthus impetiginosus]
MAEKDQHDQESGATAHEIFMELQSQQREHKMWPPCAVPHPVPCPGAIAHELFIELQFQQTQHKSCPSPPPTPPCPSQCQTPPPPTPCRSPCHTPPCPSPTRKWLLYTVLFAVSQTAIILLFARTIMRIRTPEPRLSSPVVDVTYSPDATNPSFNIRIKAEIRVKNTNFGRYKFQDSSISFCYNGATVGSQCIRNSRAGARSTKRFDVMVDLSSAGLPNQPQLGADLSSGVLILKGRASLKGEVKVLGVLKTKMSAELDCSIAINLREGIVGDLRCN